MFNPFSSSFLWVANRLANRGLIDKKRGERIVDLSWPRTLTMFSRFSQRTVDVSMIGLTVGSAGVAGIAIATIYWRLAVGISAGLAGGTISQVAQLFGGGSNDRIDLAVKQCIFIGTLFMSPFFFAYLLFTEELIQLVVTDASTVQYAVEYLQIQAIAVFFIHINLVGSRTLAGADDTHLTMYIRASGAVLNVILNVTFIFGLGMGVTGAALGTVLAEAFVMVLFVIGFIYGRVPLVGDFPVTVSMTGPYFSKDMSSNLIRMASPLMARSVSRSASNFPLFAILALFSPTVVAAFEVGRRLRNLMNASGRGFSMAGSSLVGQELGQGNEQEATNYGKDILTFSFFIYAITATFVIIFAPQIARFFAEHPDEVADIIPFVRVAAISAIGYSLSESWTGILKGAGDNSWVLYAQLVSKYLILVPITYLGSITTLGVFGVYIAFILEAWAIAAITYYRFSSGKWIIVNRVYRPTPTND